MARVSKYIEFITDKVGKYFIRANSIVCVDNKSLEEKLSSMYKWRFIGYANGGGSTNITINGSFQEVLLVCGVNGMDETNRRVLASTIIPKEHLLYNSTDNNGYHQVRYVDEQVYGGGLNKTGTNTYTIRSKGTSLIRVYVR